MNSTPPHSQECRTLPNLATSTQPTLYKYNTLQDHEILPKRLIDRIKDIHAIYA